MTFDIGLLFFAATAYLLLLFLIAHAAERHWLPSRVIHHPAVYVLSLGVYATTWSYYGSVGLAAQQGASFLTIYLGVSLTFILTPVLLMPLLQLLRRHQLTSAADLFAFRFHSQAAGSLVTVIMLAGSLPYIALQIRAVAESTQYLSGESSPGIIAIGFCLLIALFTIVFGARHVTPREKNSGLVLAIAFESLVKLLALLILAWISVRLAFGGPAGLDDWLRDNPERLAHFHDRALDGPWSSLLLMSFAAAFLLPRQFHMLFTENQNQRALLSASWGFPLFLLLLALAVPPLLWSGEVLGAGTNPDYYVLGLSLLSESRALTVLTFLGGVSAASGMIIVATLALSSMLLNHVVLPLTRLRPSRNLYASLRWTRRALIVTVIAAGYGFYLILEQSDALVAWGLISFLAMAQFLPGIVGVLFWSGATRKGFISGLAAGTAVWAVTVLLPSIGPYNLPALLGINLSGINAYGTITFWSLSVNGLVFSLVSLLTRQNEQERQAAADCRNVSIRLSAPLVQAQSPEQFVKRLAPVTGLAAARKEVLSALGDLGLDWQERRPERLHQLRQQIERNLSGMLGPVVARMIVDERLQLDSETQIALVRNMQLIEDQLETSRNRFRGIAAELDSLRRYHRQILEDLPLGVVALAQHGRIVRWNPAMAKLTGVSAEDALGRKLETLPAPWGDFFYQFLHEEHRHVHKRPLQVDKQTRWLSLHRANIAEPVRGTPGDSLLLVEDLTEMQMLERELAHSERLASIGRLAAGVAHEIGNPVTGIACLAQELQQEELPESDRAMASQILEQTHRITNIVHTLVSYAHAGGPDQRRPMPVKLEATVREALQVVQLSKRARALHFENAIPPDLRVLGDGQRLVQVFVNLFTNAADVCSEQGSVSIRARSYRGHAVVFVRDNGPGIPAELRDKVLEPFFTTKPPGQGTGLGLTLVYNIIKEHGGDMALDSSERGTRVRLTLPLAKSET